MHPIADSTIGKIHHDARKEAWYGNHYNPFRKTMRRSNTFPRPNGEDVEAGQGVSDVPLSAISTAPSPSSKPFEEYDANEAAKREETGSIGRPSDPDTEATFVGKAPSRAPSKAPSKEEKARRRFIGRFKKDKQEDEDDDTEKKRPWYKGKVLKHKPFTVRNQFQATVLNSWINVLLLAAPVGIALNYAGVDKIIVFVVNFIAIIPLAAMLSFATEEIALHVGESLGGLLNATFGYVRFDHFKPI